MITQTHPRSIRFVAAAALALGLAGPAFAEDPVHAATCDSVGRAIAEQGNAALQQIREDLRQSLDGTLRPQPTAVPQHRAQPQPVRTGQVTA